MKNILLFLSISIITSSAFSQDRYYVSFNTGYAISASKDVLGSSYKSFDGSNYKRSNIYGTYGAGIPFTLRAGSKINNNLTAELGFSYLLRTNVTIDESSTTNTESSTKVKGSQLKITPSLMFAGKNEALHLYSRIGLILPIGSTSKSSQITSYNDPGIDTTETILNYDQTNAFAIGYFGALGVSLKIANNMHFFAEVELVSLKMKQKTSSNTVFTINGEDKLEGTPIKYKETVYVDELTSSDNIKNNEPLKVRAETQNFSSVGLNIGVKLFF